MINIAQNHGALLVGGFLATWLSGIVIVQVLLYFKIYPRDSPLAKLVVLAICCLDISHSCLVFTTLWHHLIMHFGQRAHVYSIPLVLSLTIPLTAITTLLVHCFFIYRISLLSRRNWYIVVPISILAVCRLCSAIATCCEMMRLRSFVSFKAEFTWLFSLGLALSSMVDILITIFLSSLLRRNRSRSSGLNHIIDSLILYTLETGALTCAATIAVMIVWLTMNHNLIFMSLHFIIGKLYANSLLATLNTRYQLRQANREIVESDRNRPPLPVSIALPSTVLSTLGPFSEEIGMDMQTIRISAEKSDSYDSN